MKTIFLGGLVLIGVAGSAQAEPMTASETAYPKGSIGYDALVTGDNDRAISEIKASNRISRHDPARLINLGQAYARTGRAAEAEEMFTAAMQSRAEVDLILANGQVIGSKEAARRALASLRTSIATR